MDELENLEVQVDAELALVEASVDPVGEDEPEAAPYAARLHSLHAAVISLESGQRPTP
jgi:hypothetical protein